MSAWPGDGVTTMTDDISVDGYVAKLVSDDELILNVGREQGVRRGDHFQVLDRESIEVQDPITGASLGSIKRTLATVEVVRVADHLAVARVAGRKSGMSDMAALLSGSTRAKSRVLSEGWPEGVRTGDPVMKVERPETEAPGDTQAETQP